VVFAKQSPRLLNKSVLDFKVIHPIAELFSMDEQEYSKEMNSWSIRAKWPRAISEAKGSGFASYDHELVDWESKTLYRLRTEPNGNDYPWEAHPLGNGFLVWSGNTDWSSGAPQLLAYYSTSGELEWAKQIKVGELPFSEYNCTGAPHAIQSFERTVRFYQSCRVASPDKQRIRSKENEGIVWTIDRREFLKASQARKTAKEIQSNPMQQKTP
jgi:hypothetical protein